MVRFKNFDCTINVDGVALREYTDPGDAAEREGPVPTAIVYIQSEEGKTFSIKFDILNDAGLFPQANAVCCYPKLDGNRTRDWITPVFKGGILEFDFYQNAEGRSLRREFLFSKLDVIESGPVHRDNNDTSSLGEITIGICRFKITQSMRRATGRELEHSKTVHTVRSIHEKHLKGRDISHSVRMSAPKPASRPNVFPGYFPDERGSLYAAIKFRYRTERALKGLGLLPRTPLPSLSPQPATVDANSVSPEEMTREEMLAEIHRLRAAQPSEVKLEKTATNKRETSEIAGPSTLAPKKRKKRKVIDLTGDSD